MIKLSDVTLITFTGKNIDNHIYAMLKCMENIKFGDVKFLSYLDKPKNLPKNVYYEKISTFYDMMDFNNFCFYNLYKYIETSHALLFQDHAYILNSDMWTNAFLNCDWIGAPWPIKENSYIANNEEIVRVGNGGFSLRSRKILELPTKLGLKLKEQQGYYNEDGNFCVYHRKEMLANDVIYAPTDLAALFSFENFVPENEWLSKTFGFHRNKGVNK